MLSINHLNKIYGTKTALQDLNLSVDLGKSYGLLGRNGAGKTTTIRIILDIIQATSGEVTWKGLDIKKNKPKRGYLPEERGLYPKSTIYDQLIYLARLEGMSLSDAKQAVLHWSKRLEVEEYLHQKPEQLSKGNQQKVQIASTLLHDPELVIFDEPFSGLDPVNANLLCEVIDELRKAGKTLLFSSHQMGYVEKFCDEISILKKGSQIVQGSIDQIKKERDKHELLVELDSEDERGKLISWTNAMNISVRETDGLCFVLQGKAELKKRLMQSIIQHGIYARKMEWLLPSLHDIFVEEAGE